MIFYMIMMLPALALCMLAQWMVQNAFKTMSQVPASMTGAQAARRILDAQGLRDIPIEMVAGIFRTITTRRIKSFD